MSHFLVKFTGRGRAKRPNVAFDRTRISLGSRPTADIYLNDRMLPREAAFFLFDGSRLQLEVNSEQSLAGVFVDGSAVEGTVPVASGSVVQSGHSKIEVEVDGEKSLCTLTVSEKYLPGVVDKIVKKTKPEIPFALVDSGPQEHRWGKSPHMKRLNWLGVFLGVLLLAAFPFTKDTQVMSRGELASYHQVGAEGHGDRSVESCADCHDPFDSHYAGSCATCHEGYSTAGGSDTGERASGEYLGHPYHFADETSCARCHADHRGADVKLAPVIGDEGAASSFCTSCHGPKKEGVDYRLDDLQGRLKDPPGVPTDRWLLVDGFSHADHRVVRTGTATSSIAASKPQAGDVPIACAECHKTPQESGTEPSAPHSDFGAVTYESCLACHAEWRVEPERIHGRDEDGKGCYACHAPAENPADVTAALREVELEVTRSMYVLTPRKHDYKSDQCLECHVLAPLSAGKKSSIAKRVFRHDHHLPTVTPAQGAELALSKLCAECHTDVANSESLAGVDIANTTWTGVNTSGCVSCHTEGEVTAIPVEGGGMRTVRDMFHSVHTADSASVSTGALATRSSRQTLSAGCLSCHVPVAGTERMEFRVREVRPGHTLSGSDGILDCKACHTGHENVGQGKCAICHVDRRPDGPNWLGEAPDRSFVFRFQDPGIFNREKATVKKTPVIGRFDHTSPGHLGHDCTECHDPEQIDSAERVLDVPYPSFDDPACVRCHVDERYHR